MHYFIVGKGPFIKSKSISTGAQYVTPDSQKFLSKKSKCASFSLVQEIGIFCTKFVQLAVAGKRRNTVVHLQKKSVTYRTWLRLNISDWSIIMIGPGGLLLVVPTYTQFQLQFNWWGGQNKKG